MSTKLNIKHVPAVVQVADSLSSADRLAIFTRLAAKAGTKPDDGRDFWYEQPSAENGHRHIIFLCVFNDVVNFLNFYYDAEGNLSEVTVSPTLRIMIDPPVEQISGDPLITLLDEVD